MFLVMTILTSLPGDGIFVNIQSDKLLHVLVMTILTALPGDGIFVNIHPDKLLHVFGYGNPYLSAR